jgi:hypothetical protein
MNHDLSLATSVRSLNQTVNQDQIATFVRESPAAAIGLMIALIVSFAAPFVWFGICWGAFRRIHRISAGSSWVAYGFVMLLLLVFASIWSFMMTALHGPHGPSIF